MATNLAIDERLLEEALRIGGCPSKKATVNEALSEYINRRRRRRILSLFGKLDWQAYPYKKMRRRG